MWFKRMVLEDWFDTHQYEVEYDVGESAIKFLTLDQLDFDLGPLALRYGYHLGLPLLREAIASQYENLSADDVVVTSGASEANFAVVASLVKPGDHVIVEHPNYPSLYEVPRSLGCDVSLFKLSMDDDFRPDLASLESLIQPHTKLISLTHPNNPTGSMITADELGRVVQLAEEHDVYLMFDETYRDLTFEDQLPGAATLSANVISISSMSKCYGLPGIRIGWLVTQSPGIRRAALAAREQVTIANNAVGEAIALRVLERKNEHIERGLRHALSNLDVVTDWISRQSEIDWVKPAAGVVGLPRITNKTIEPESVYKTLVDKYRTFVVPGRCFEMDNEFFRLGYGGTAEELSTGLANITNAVNDAKLGATSD